MLIDDAARIEYVTSNVESLIGWTPEEFVGRLAFDFVHPSDVATLIGVVQTVSEHGAATDHRAGLIRKRYTHDIRLRTADGRWQIVTARAVGRFHDENVRGMLVLLQQPDHYRDLFEAVQSIAAKAAPAASIDLLLRALCPAGQTGTVAAVVDERSVIVSQTDSAPFHRGDVLHASFDVTFPAVATWAVPIDAGSRGTWQLLVASVNEVIHPVDRFIADQIAELAGLALRSDDALRQLETLSETDVLTGAFNRRALTSLVNEGSASAFRFAALIDLDRFKAINDRYGHVAGDAVLVEAVRLIRDVVRSSDVVVRLGGDEFMVLFRGAGVTERGELNDGQVAAVFGRLEASLSRFEVAHGASRSVVSATLGLAPIERGDIDGAMASADGVMYAKKRVRQEKLTEFAQQP
jgi:diguanylate cyclase (GGDEF)-like protein